MNGIALRILKKVAKSGEISLAEAIRLARPHYRDHRDQYPLTLLLEEGYLGMTVNHSPPDGSEKMREFTLANTLHVFSLPKSERGGALEPKDESVFLRAKGALYLDERRQKQSDRIWYFLLGLIAGIFTSITSAWVQGKLKLP